MRMRQDEIYKYEDELDKHLRDYVRRHLYINWVTRDCSVDEADMKVRTIEINPLDKTPEETARQITLEWEFFRAKKHLYIKGEFYIAEVATAVGGLKYHFHLIMGTRDTETPRVLRTESIH